MIESLNGPSSPARVTPLVRGDHASTNTTTSTSQTVSYSNPSGDGKTLAGHLVRRPRWPTAFTTPSSTMPTSAASPSLSDVTYAFHCLFRRHQTAMQPSTPPTMAAFLAALHLDALCPAIRGPRSMPTAITGCSTPTTAFFLGSYGTTLHLHPDPALRSSSAPRPPPPPAPTDISSWVGGVDSMYYKGLQPHRASATPAPAAPGEQDVWGLGYVNSLIRAGQPPRPSIPAACSPTSHFLQYAVDNRLRWHRHPGSAAPAATTASAIQPSNSDVVGRRRPAARTWVVARVWAPTARSIPRLAPAATVTISENFAHPSPNWPSTPPATSDVGRQHRQHCRGLPAQQQRRPPTGAPPSPSPPAWLPQGIALEPSGDIVVAGDSFRAAPASTSPGLNPQHRRDR